MAADYENSPKWADVIPIPQNDGERNALASIAYTEEYSTAMSYLRAVMAANEQSERALELTEHIISMNPAHYTVWLFRASTLKHLKHDPRDELEWLINISLKHLKNYQIWHHRQVTMDQLDTLPPTEISFLGRMLAKDVKNYHVWSYRQWLVRRFGLWANGLPESPSGPSDSELSFTSALLESDLRNNSAWNHRFFVIFGNEDGVPITEDVYESEIEFAKSKIFLAPQNQSAWNYLKGVLKRKGKGIADMECFAKEFVDLEGGECKSSHALDLLAEIWAKNQAEKAGKALDLLAKKYDPIRKNYWEYRKRQIGHLLNHAESRSSSAIRVD